MKRSMKLVLFWSPRILGILFAMFLSMFAIDVFEEGPGFWDMLLALLIHLIPIFILIIVLVIAWRREWVGAVVFTALAVFYVVWAWGKFHWSAYVVISGPLILSGVLFLFNWIHRGDL